MDLSKHLEKADEAVKRRNYAFAVNLYGQLLGLQPDNGKARAGLRTALFKKAEQKKPSKAFAMVAGGIHLLVGKVSALCGGHGAAAKAYERYLAMDPLAEGPNLALAEALERAGHKHSALAVYRAFAEHEPRCLPAARAAGRLLYETGELQDAYAMFEQALKVDPRDQEALRARKNLAAEGALRQTGIETAKSSRELIKDKEQQKRLEKSARRQLSAEEIEAELDEVENRLAAEPDDVEALLRAGELHEMRRDLQVALDCFERAAELRRDDAGLEVRVGDLRLRVQEGRVAKAEAAGDRTAAGIAREALAGMRVAEFRRRVERLPTDLGLRFELGQALLAAGEHDQAIGELQQAVKDPRRQAEALLALGRAFRAKDLGDLAIAQLEKALAAAGGDALRKDIRYELGEVAELGGDREAALKHFGAILESDYGFKDVAERVAKLK
jgi:tetratricopeptide (TPR) repeat protein